MAEEKGIIIELSNIRAKKFHNENGTSNHILLDKYYEKIADLISDRIKEIDRYKTVGFDIDNINEVKMHDSILVYGSRGNGKSTVMINLKEFITGEYCVDNAQKLQGKVKVFETIDPTIQEEDEDFLLVILSAILKEVESHQEDKYFKRDGFYDSLENVLKIVEATRSSNKDNIDIFNKFYGLKSGVGLAEELHKLFKATKDIFGVEILVIPIDDVDMNLKQGYQIADSIRKYMSSPYIIPIVAFNIRQMRVVTKYNKYKQFDLKIDKELELEELSFLRSLPNDYLSKVFPPNRRIYLKSVFEILKNIDEKNDENHQVFFTINSRDNKESIKFKILDMVSLISELFYETYYDENSFKDIYASIFLTNRSMRNFFNDCYAILLSLEDKNSHYSINWKIIKDRLSPDDIPAFVTKKHALTWLWNEYIQLAKNNLINKNNILNYNWARMVTETLPEDNSAEIINKKTYARVWLQKFYRVKDKEKIEKTVNFTTKKREYRYIKSCDMVGALELAMRSYIPMYLFETIVRNNNLKYDNSDLVYLKSFATRSLQIIAYELSMMENSLHKDGKKNDSKPIGSVIVYEKNDSSNRKDAYEIKDKELNIPFLFKVSNQYKYKASKGSNVVKKQIYILSIFKALAFFIELSKIDKKEYNKEKREVLIKALIEKYRVNMPTIDNPTKMQEEYFQECINIDKSVSNIANILNIELANSSFGVLEIASFSKRLVDYFMHIRDNISEDSLDFTQKRESNKSDFYLPIVTYFTSFTQSLFVSLFNSIKHDNVLSIKTKDGNKIIFRKNSLYGLDKNVSKKDHLYQENIINLIETIECNNSEDEEIASMQESFCKFFNYINRDVPFFKFLIDEANFLTKIKEHERGCKDNASN